MDIIVIIFMAIATIFALSSLGYVAVDVILEVRGNKEPVVVPPEPEPEPEPMPEFVESEPVEIPEDLPEPESVEEGIEVIDVAWPESMAKNKIYKYDPCGEILHRGDTVLVPTFDRHRHGEILRMATVINGNYRVESLPEGRVLKKIERVLR